MTLLVPTRFGEGKFGAGMLGYRPVAQPGTDTGQPFLIQVFDKSFARVGVIGRPTTVTITPRFNAQGTGSVAVDTTDPTAVHLLTEGCRLTVDYAGDQIMSGIVNSLQATGPNGTLTAQLEDDFDLFSYLLAYPGPIVDAKAPDYDTQSGPAETVLKHYVDAAAGRLGLPVTTTPDQERGSTIKVNGRFKPLHDYLFPRVTNAGLGVTVRQQGAGLVVDVYEPSTFPITLTPDTGIVADWSWSWQAPSITRTVAGGQGNLSARALATYVDTLTESTWGVVRETFVDASDVDNDTDLQQRAEDAQIEGRRRTGLSLTLMETASFRYGNHLRVGDTVTEQLVPGTASRTHTLTEATLNWSREDGFTATPTVGDIDTQSRRIARGLAKALAQLRDLGSR